MVTANSSPPHRTSSARVTYATSCGENSCIGRPLEPLLVSLRGVALEAVDQAGLGSAERQPVVSRLLQGDEELLTPLDGLLVEIVPAFELGLEGKFATQRLVHAALAPQREIAVRGDSL